MVFFSGITNEVIYSETFIHFKDISTILENETHNLP